MDTSPPAPMAPSDPEPKANHPAAGPARETFVLMCPYCYHAAVVPLGRVTTSPVGMVARIDTGTNAAGSKPSFW